MNDAEGFMATFFPESSWPEPLDINSANKLAPLLCSIMKSAVEKHEKLILIRTKINVITSNILELEKEEQKELLRTLELLSFEMKNLVNSLNDYVLEVENLGGEFTSIKNGIITFYSKRRNIPVCISITKNDNKFRYWRQLQENLACSRLIDF